MKPRISFLIATKNRSRVIKDTIDSFINQEVEDWEAIIVDDHGNDNTQKVVEQYQDNRLRYFKLSDIHGFGTSCARNLAAIYANSEIVAISDSDDISYSNRILLTLDGFDKNPEADIFYGNIDVWEEATGIVRSRKTPFFPYSFEKIKDIHFIPYSTVAMKRKVLLNNPYNQFFRIAEDYELLTRLAVLGKNFIFTDQKIVKYRISSDNLSIGQGKKELATNYGLLVKMVRGWIPFDYQILGKIEELERKLS